MLVTLLTKATTLHPDLPVFAPDFHARIASDGATVGVEKTKQPSANGHAHPMAAQPEPTFAPQTFFGSNTTQAIPGTTAEAALNTLGGTTFPGGATAAADYVPEEHPPNYPRPGYGLMKTLPPEQEDLQWLVDADDRYGVFTHMYQVDPHAASAGMNGNAS